MIFFSSDWHLDHINIVKYDNRPFDTIEQMNDTIINNANKVVRPEDTLYYLGDFCFALNGKLDKIYEFRDRIKCRNVHFILGNHDNVIRKNAGILIRDQVFLTITDVFTVKSTKPSIFLSHYPHITWDHANHGRYHLHGHCHHNLQEDPNALRFDVGVNGWNYYPVSFDRVKEKMTAKHFVPVDHHNRETN